MTKADRLADDLKNLTLAEHQQLPPKENRTALVYDEEFVEHKCLWDPDYPERPERFSESLQRCRDYNLVDRTLKIPSRSATEEELLTLHSPELIETLRKTRGSKNVEKLEELSSKYDSTYIHPKTYELALKSAGSALNLLEAVVDGKAQNGMAIIRPPGHHAMENEFCGYCFFNNVALAAKNAIDKHDFKRILIVDWDVHHGQATQYFFYDDPRVLYFSIHRYEHGEFWPELRESNFDHVGEGKGKGYNINVPLNQVGLGNAEYLAIFNNVLLPVAYEFSPDLVLVSSGYDAAVGCPEGLMEVTPACYAHMLTSLMALAEGKVCVFLEGGYCLKSLAEGVALTLRCLLGDPCPRIGPLPAPLPGSQEAILNVISAIRPYWKSLAFQGTYDIKKTERKEGRKRHKPEIQYKGTLSIKKPEKYPTRQCYLKHPGDKLTEYDKKIDRLIAEMDLTVPPSRVALVFDQQMSLHQSILEKVHPEKPDRILVMYAQLKELGLAEKCLALPSRHATDEELGLVHGKDHISKMKSMANMTPKQLVKTQEEYPSVYFCQASYKCATLAAGCLLQVVDSVLEGKSRSGVAIIRPPGHHAEKSEACGFCLFNNVSIAAQYALTHHNVKRILIVDWDVHHGNGTQHAFYETEKVLYISVHRYDNSLFFPFSYEADSNYAGKGRGQGFNVNIPWNKGRMGDGEYMAAFFQLVLPIAQQFDPDLVLVSSGFDAAKGDPLGGCRVTPYCYGHMTHLLTSLAGGRVILALEGGYNVPVIAECMSSCVSALLGHPLSSMPVGLKPTQSAIDSILKTVRAQQSYWGCLKFDVDLPGIKGERDAEKVVAKSSVGSPLDEGEAGACGVTVTLPMPVGTLFCVKPIDWCPHLVQIPKSDLPNFDVNAPCLDCKDVTENWMCLYCHQIHCARYVNGHMMKHGTDAEHPLTISFSDLSIWCYLCEAYVDNEVIHPIKDLVHRKKFGISIKALQ